MDDISKQVDVSNLKSQRVRGLTPSGSPARLSLRVYLAEMSFRCGSARVVRGIANGELGPA